MGYRCVRSACSGCCTHAPTLCRHRADHCGREPTLIIDVRTAEEFAAGHFPGAINIPHEDIIQGIKESNVGKDQTVLLYCRSGNRSGQAEGRLQSAGFSGAKNVGGLNALLAATGRTAALPNH